MFYKKITQTLALLFIPTLGFAVNVGDTITILRESHPWYPSTGTVLSMSETGIALDFTGNGMFDGGVSQATAGTNWEVVDFVEQSEFEPFDVGRQVDIFEHPTSPYHISIKGGTHEIALYHSASRVYLNANDVNGASYPLYGTNRGIWWDWADPVETWPKERQRFEIRYITGKDPAGGDYGFLVVLDTYAKWFNAQQMQFQVSDPQIFQTKIQTSYIYSTQSQPYPGTLYKLNKINMFPLQNGLTHPKIYLNSISADTNNPSALAYVQDNTAYYSFKYHIHITWDILGSQNSNAPDTYTKYITDEIILSSTYN
jgi:hypothetical protein